MWALRGEPAPCVELSARAADSTTWRPASSDLCLSAWRFGWCSRRVAPVDASHSKVAQAAQGLPLARREEAQHEEDAGRGYPEGSLRRAVLRPRLPGAIGGRGRFSQGLGRRDPRQTVLFLHV